MSAEKIYKSFAELVSQGMNTCISLVKIVLKSRPGLKLPETTEKTCVILGNGPSLNQSLAQYGDTLAQKHLVCVNGFSLSEQYPVLKPKYYIILDEGFWLGNHEVLKNIIDNIINHTTWPLIMYVPISARKHKLFAILSEKNSNIKIIFFNYTVFKGFESIATIFYKNNLAMPQCQNILVASIFLCINMNYKEIYLLGADHTWHQNLHVNDNNELCVKLTHFYENEEKVTYQPFRKGWHSKEMFTMHEILAAWTKVFSGYFTLNNYAKGRNCKIYNASEVSFIDAFERKKL